MWIEKLTPSWKRTLNNTQMVGTLLQTPGPTWSSTCRMPRVVLVWHLMTLLKTSFYTTTSLFVVWLGDFSQERQDLWLHKDDLQDPSSWSSSPLLILRDIHSNLLVEYGCEEGSVSSQSQTYVGVSGRLCSRDGDTRFYGQTSSQRWDLVFWTLEDILCLLCRYNNPGSDGVSSLGLWLQIFFYWWSRWSC